MTGHLSAADGFKIWRDEVISLSQPEKFVPYIPAIALVGIYVATRGDDRLTSYDWRQAVLKSHEAIEGFRRSIDSAFKDRIDDTFELPVDYFELANDASLQDQAKYGSIMDGLPEAVTTMPENEVFLAETIGLGHHDECIGLRPLKLYVQGQHVLQEHYPVTAHQIGLLQ